MREAKCQAYIWSLINTGQPVENPRVCCSVWDGSSTPTSHPTERARLSRPEGCRFGEPPVSVGLTQQAVFQVDDAMLMFDKTTNRHRGECCPSPAPGRPGPVVSHGGCRSQLLFHVAS